MNDLKKAYNIKDWEKAAKNCQQVHNDLRRWFPDLDFPLGFGALSAKEETKEHDSAEPDIFVKFVGVTIAGIEVTGSERINAPSELWIGHHKIEYAINAQFPIMYVLFYSDKVLCVSANLVRSFNSERKSFQIRGNLERYYTIESKFVFPYDYLKIWLEKIRTEHLRRLGYVRR